MDDDGTESATDAGDETAAPVAVVTRAQRARTIAMLLGHGVVTWSLRLALPLVFANALLRAFPYRAKVAGVPFRVQGTLFSRRGFTADTTFGNWEFPHVDGLPIGVHISPMNVDLLRLSRAANPDSSVFVDQLKRGFSDQLPLIVLWLVGITLLGVALGLASSASINMTVRYLRRIPRREHELRLRLRQLAIAGIALLLVSGYGVISFNEHWDKQSRLTGTLGAVQLFPDQLQKFYSRQSKVYDVLGAVVGIQAQLQSRIDEQNTPDTSFNIMFISDVHLAGVYPLVEQYVNSFDVKLIVNTGDESEFGSTVELTPGYLNGLARITKKVPMIWLAGNHDSPDTEAAMRHIEGVTVLGSKTKEADGSYDVTGSKLSAYGLTIAGAPDPRVYGASGPSGSDKDQVTDPLERDAMDAVADTAGPDTKFDIFATHEPPAAKELTKKLPKRIRQTNSGHTHEQNKIGDIQSGENINLVEGSTGAGGLDHIMGKASPIEFSIESVAASCQFTKLLRFQVADPAMAQTANPVAAREDVTVSTVYLAPQKVSANRYCGTSAGIGRVTDLATPITTDDNGG
jgi:predicted MPP superfamily phosphohydrolase